jgi:hypothetical protein
MDSAKGLSAWPFKAMQKIAHPVPGPTPFVCLSVSALRMAAAGRSCKKAACQTTGGLPADAWKLSGGGE